MASAEFSPAKLTTSLVVPTYGRPGPLARAIRSVWEGSLLPNQLIVVVRRGDEPTLRQVEALEEACPGDISFEKIEVEAPGHIAPVETGFAAATGEIVVLIDDDVVVSRDWLQNLLGPFADPVVGVTGGPVPVPGRAGPTPRRRSGTVSWAGRYRVGIGWQLDGAPCETDSVPEGNSAWRRELLAQLRIPVALDFDDSFFYGLELTLQAKHLGYKVVFVPVARVDHHVAPRPDALGRARRDQRFFALAHNYTFVLWRHLGVTRRWAFAAWWWLWGEAQTPGPLRLPWDWLRRDFRATPHFWTVQLGKWQGLRAAVDSRGSQPS